MIRAFVTTLVDPIKMIFDKQPGLLLVTTVELPVSALFFTEVGSTGLVHPLKAMTGSVTLGVQPSEEYYDFNPYPKDYLVSMQRRPKIPVLAHKEII